MTDKIPIEVVPYNPDWPAMFAATESEIRAAIGSYIVALEHIGSTAVPGLAAKPVIDILIAVRDLKKDAQFIPSLEAIGYKYIAAHESIFPERRYLQRIIENQHTHHLHIVEKDSRFYGVQLAFRDHLRTHPTDATRYAALKYELAAQHRDDREAYTDAKSVFINEILEQAVNTPINPL